MMAFVLALSLLVQSDPAPVKDSTANEALDRFKTAYKSKDVAERSAAATELAKTPHDKVVAKLGALLLVDDMTVRIAAAKGLGGTQGDLRKKAVNALSRAFPANAEQPLVVVACVEAMETMQDGMGYAVLRANLKVPDVQTSKASIEAMNLIRDKSFVAPLIEWARFLEAASREATNVGPNGRTVTGGGMIPGGGTVGDPEAPRRARILVPLVHKALESITKQNFKSMNEWAEWWRKNEADFKPAK